MIRKQIPLIILALALGGCVSPTASTETGGKGERQVTTDVVKRQDLTGYSFFDGKLVIPETAKATAFSPYETPVLTVMTLQGKHVDKGDEIIKLTIPGADAAAAAAKVNVETARADYSAQKGDMSPQLQEAERTLKDAQAAEKDARDTVASGGQADVEASTTARIAAESALAQIKQEMRRSLAPTKSAIDLASSELKMAKADAAKGIVRAPISGTIVTLPAQPGMLVTAKQPLATIVNFEAARVQGLVPPELKDLVVKNSHVIIAMNGTSSDPLDGTVEDVSVVPPTAGQQSSGYLAVIEFLNPNAMAQPSMSVKRIGVKTGTVKDALVVPVGAITVRDGISYVSVQNGDKWVDTKVETGLSDGALTEIKSGLAEGAVIRVVSQVRDGRKM
jgi:biotin carboxyl carrier protein